MTNVPVDLSTVRRQGGVEWSTVGCDNRLYMRVGGGGFPRHPGEWETSGSPEAPLRTPPLSTLTFTQPTC